MRSRAPGRLGVWLIAALMFAAMAAWGEAASISPGDWQYRELDALAQAGLLQGHPKGPIGDWAGERLTRFEAASLTLRAVEGVGQAYREQGEALLQVAQAEVAAEQPAPVGVSVTDLARVEKLIQEFRTELVTMGARVDDLETAVKDAQSRLGKVEAEQKKHKIDGYMQVRYRDDNATDGKNEFLVRRARVNVRGPVSDRASYQVEFQLDAREGSKGPGSKVQLRTGYLDYRLNTGMLRFGQATLPWGYELLDSTADLWTGERSFFMDRLFPEQRDIGIQWWFRRSAAAPRFDVGIVNGTGINASDNNSKKNVLARVDFPVRSGTFALSGYVGKDGAGDAETDQDRYGASARFRWPCGTEFQGEFVTGKDKGSDVSGWYGQVGHPLSKKAPNLLFVKYDRFDEDADAPDDLFKRWSLGYWYEIDPATRLSLVYERRDAEPGFSELSKWDGNATWLQMRVKF